MASTMVAGGNVSLTRENPDVGTVVVGFGWDIIKSGGPHVEVVPSAILCGKDGKAVDPSALVFFNQTLSEDETVEYVAKGDEEQIELDVAFIPENIEKIVFVVYVNPEHRRPGNFGSIRSAYIRVAKPDNTEMTRFDIPSNFLTADVNAMIFGELYRYKGEWKFRAVGQGYSSGLQGVVDDFKVAI